MGFRFKKVNKKKLYLISTTLIIILASYLRFSGFDWALPKKPYYRSGFQDESFVINLILRMDPKDFNPHYFINPSFHFYTLLLAIKFSHLTGYIKNFSHPVVTNLQGQPVEKITLNDYEKMYTVSRLLTVIEGILTCLLIYLIGSKLYNKETGLLASFIFSILPTHVFQSHFFVVDAPAVFWSIFSLYYMVQALKKKQVKRSYFIISGILLGLSLGTKYMNLLMLFPFIMIYLLKWQDRDLKKPLITISTMLFIFLLTTPHSLLSLKEFLYGDSEGFGGIFGSKGLFAYNSYPSHPIKPFAYIFYYSLRLPLAILAFLSFGYIIYRRDIGDKIILSFLIPFFLIMVISPSPHLRHSLPAMPFISLMVSSSIIGLIKKIRNKYLLSGFNIFTIFVLLYTLLFTMAMVDRMRYPDTRIEFADWVFRNIPAHTTIGCSTVMPFRYTPPVERPGYDGSSIAPTDDEILSSLHYDFIKVNYDYYTLLYHMPEYFFITQIECDELPYNEVGEVNGRNFIRRLFSNEYYSLIKTFERKYNILGIKFDPDFPNLDWNPVSQKIYLFKRKS